jgi:preprotein translocase subunit YajC
VILAAESSGGGSAALSQLLFFAVLLVGMYLLLLRPQRTRARQLAAVRSSVRSGARVVTTAGLHARVVEVREDEPTLVLEIAPGVHAVFAKAAVIQVLDESAPVEPDAAA